MFVVDFRSPNGPKHWRYSYLLHSFENNRNRQKGTQCTVNYFLCANFIIRIGIHNYSHNYCHHYNDHCHGSYCVTVLIIHNVIVTVPV